MTRGKGPWGPWIPDEEVDWWAALAIGACLGIAIGTWVATRVVEQACGARQEMREAQQDERRL